MIAQQFGTLLDNISLLPLVHMASRHLVHVAPVY